MKVKECMCENVCYCNSNSTISEAAKKMSENHIGCIPVCNDEKCVVGILTDRDMQDYQGRYNDLYEEWKRIRESGNKEDITDDIVFEIELIKQIEINIDYILLLVKKYHDSHCQDKEILISINKAVESSLELRSKKALIENFIAGINDVEDVMIEWRQFVVQQKKT